MTLTVSALAVVVRTAPVWARLVARGRAAWCVTACGGHEFYRAHTATWIGQECILCGHRTLGWDVTPRRGRS